MIDIIREIEAVEREVGSGRLAAGAGTSVFFAGRMPPRSRTSGTR